jgi:hypothetical protein
MNTRLYIAKSANVLNCLFMLAIFAAANDTVVPLLNTKVQTSLPAIGYSETETAEQPASPPGRSSSDYVLVAEQNLFHPDRKIPEDKKALSESVVPKPDLVLHGTLIADHLSIAYVEDRKAPYATPGRGVRQQQLRQGDCIGGYTLRDVEPNRIILVRGEEKLAVLFDEKALKRGGETTTPAVATLAPGGLPPGPVESAVSPPALSSAATAPPVAFPPPASVQGEKSPVQPGPAVIRPGVHVSDPRKLRLQNK